MSDAGEKQRKPGLARPELRRDDYRTVFGTDGHRSAAQERVWKEIVMDPILEESQMESENPRKARDLSIRIYKLVNKNNLQKKGVS